MTSLSTLPSEDEKLRQIHGCFHACFRENFGTELVGSFSEPIYTPMQGDALAVVGYRENYVRSALHEIAHWCVAGERRRTLEDYGYWYEPDGRSAVQQEEFFRVEVKPQALEYAFCLALDIPFEVSCDNLGNQHLGGDEDFRQQVMEQLVQMIRAGFPPRARIFLDELVRQSDLHWLEEKIKGL